MSNAFKDLTSISRGEAKARRDITKARAFNADHEAKHEADSDYNCVGDIREFWGTLGLDVRDCGDEIQIGAYKRTMNAFHAEDDKNSPLVGVFEIDPSKIDSDDPMGSIMSQVMESIETRMAFDAVVSETDGAQNNNDQKGDN